MEQHNIIFMTKALEWLDRLKNESRSKEYIIIMNLIKNYVKSNCKHHIIKDLVDIDPDHSKEIEYCEYCNTTFC